MKLFGLMILVSAVLIAGCGDTGDRSDGAYMLVADAGSLQNPCVSPEGDRAVVTRYRDGYGRGQADLVLVDLGEGTITELLVNGSNHINQPGSCWSEAQDAIVFASDAEDDRWELYRIHPDDGGPPLRITEREGLDATEATWSDTGEWIVFTSRSAGEPDAAGTTTLINAEGGEESVLSPEGADDRHPAASPAGNLVVMESRDGDASTLVMMNLTATFREELSEGDTVDLQPSWSWSGQYVTYSSTGDDPSSTSDIYKLKIEGCDITRITESEAHDRNPAFTAGDTHILFESAVDPEGFAELWFFPNPGG